MRYATRNVREFFFLMREKYKMRLYCNIIPAVTETPFVYSTLCLSSYAFVFHLLIKLKS